MPSLQQRQLTASTRCVQLILDRGTTDLGVEDFLGTAEVSRRTFHRWFPAKEQLLRPFYAEMARRFAIRACRSLPLTVDSVAAAWEQEALGERPGHTLELHRLLRCSRSYWSVFLEVLQDGEGILAQELGATVSAQGDRWAIVTAVSVVAASRLAMDAAVLRGADPVAEFRQLLIAFDPPLLTPPA